ncbi:MAG: ferritin-like domain-containing protein [Solirubrobacteraceae bacterium]|nr:ferritin-like domain-containing protein [Solirubrobacteraceae bacterium]
MTDSALRELADDPSSRKRFFKMVGGVGVVGAFSVALAACGDDDDDDDSGAGASDSASDNASDVEILNYALTLEFLEAEFYEKVIAAGIVTDRAVVAIAQKFGESEQEHVDALRATITQLGGTPVEAPETKFEETIDKGLMATLETAATVENLGAAAYLGQAGNIKSKEVLASALAIHTVEARHAAALNILVGRGFGDGSGGLEGALPDGAFAKPMTEEQVREAIKPFLA